MNDWMTARDAVTLLEAHSVLGAPYVITKRARVGLIRAKAKLLLWDKERHDEHYIHQSFWWVGVREGSTANWTSGDFETWIGFRDDPQKIWTSRVSDVKIEAFGVTFERSGIEALLPNVETPEAQDDRPGVPTEAKDKRPAISLDSLGRFYELFVALNCQNGKRMPSEEATLAAAAAFFPRNSVARQWLRDLRGPQPLGRPENPEKVAE